MAKLNQKFDWPDVPDADSYDVVALPSGYDANVAGHLANALNQVNVLISEVGVGILLAGLSSGNYVVQARSKNAAGDSAWSPQATFTLDPPDVPGPIVVV